MADMQAELRRQGAIVTPPERAEVAAGGAEPACNRGAAVQGVR